TETVPSPMKHYGCRTGIVAGVEAIFSRTGYTGEAGFEVYAAADYAEQLWKKMLEAGKFGEDGGILPAGLAARNTLRLEAGMSLYGHELSDTISTYEANLGWITKLDKGDFTGKEILEKQKADGVSRKLVGFEMTDRGIARDEYPVYIDGKNVGAVTSGSPAPFLKKNIGFAFVPTECANPGREITIEIRGKHAGAKIVSTPFYKREK